ncbi:hypothetical protein K443DRAFT_681251 [Laccaria amethystina LaAM-08-1]|uniref:Uncharacterized protein n=1 Tax=Laccaria amethystina LaAM-08-1 TaxID=1095629 RepID=A0A0C9XJN0_9AGAR|nr:hypothetical protein K443DRAFT_681251 [Laccaria amethystina LaAM-08-1]
MAPSPPLPPLPPPNSTSPKGPSSPTSSPPYRVHLSLSPSSTGCTTYGGLDFVQGTSTNKCASYSGFQIQSNTENSQLGAQLVVNFEGGFYVCSGNTVAYKVNPGDGPSGCTPVSLYTVPVI